MKKRLVGIMPYGSGRHTVSGVTLVFAHTEIIENHHVDIVSYETLTSESLKDLLPKSLNKNAISHGFSIALNAALSPISELVRVINLVR